MHARGYFSEYFSLSRVFPLPPGVVCASLTPGVLDIRGLRDFSRFDPSPGEAPHFSKSGPPVERRPFCRVKTFLWIAATWHTL